MAVIINDDDEILMMQEAKSSCAGQWYLPAGRVEPNESIMVHLNCFPLFNFNIMKFHYSI
jgi:8-oxo-dGTP pyrophosphatase MutT (NUDIX family)